MTPISAIALALMNGNGQAYPTVDLAAVAALNEASAASHNASEYGGVIYTAVDGTIHYTVPVALGSNGGKLVIRSMPGTTKLALFHNHPENTYSTYFSPEDIATAKATHLVSYIYCAADGSIRKLAPNQLLAGASQQPFIRGLLPGVHVATVRVQP